MALCVCKCMNVKLESDKVEANVDFTKLELSTTEQRDLNFSEKLVLCASKDVKIHVAQPALISQRCLGKWIIHSCISCGQTTHAIIHDNNRSNNCLLNKSLQTTHDNINNLKKSKNYSTVFNLLVPEISTDIEMKENVDTNNLIICEQKWPPAHQVISSLSKQMNQTLQSQLEAVEENVRQFRDQKYAEYEAFREKAHRDHKIISSIISKAQLNNDNNWSNQALDNGPPSPHLPPQQRRRLSSIKDAKKITHNINKNNRNLPIDDDSLDAEELFDIEGMESRNIVNSDHDYYDSDDGSNDEGIQISRPRGGGNKADIARSLPMTIARFANDNQASRRDLDEDDYEEPEDIAASIKALARSVHGDVFELPRPRFNTQI